MAKTDEAKPKFLSRPCPQCGKPIHIKSKKHPECGWGMETTASVTAPVSAPVAAKRGRPPKQKPAAKAGPRQASPGGITLEDISAVKALVQRMGADKVQQLAAVLAK